MISAADYDPSLDRREDEERRVRGVADHDVEMIEEVEEEDDDDLDDMFAIDATEKKKKKKVRQITVGCANWIRGFVFADGILEAYSPCFDQDNIGHRSRLRRILSGYSR